MKLPRTGRTFTAPLLLLLSLFPLLSSAQIIGGHRSGQSTPQEVQAATIDAGALAGDVNLFTGTYNSNYALGSVSTVSGDLSYTLQASNSSTFSSGDNLPHTTGIPYGEGWQLDLPSITVSTEDYNKYSILAAQAIGNRNSMGVQTKEYYTSDPAGDRNEAYGEGGLYWFAPMLNIPGVASGRLVYKYESQGQYVFVLHQFERYIEAHFDGNRWEVVLDDGTRYELGVAKVSHRQASNQRVEQVCYESGGGGNTLAQGGPLPNLVLPKTEVLSWYCVRIYHRARVGQIRF